MGVARGVAVKREAGGEWVEGWGEPSRRAGVEGERDGEGQGKKVGTEGAKRRLWDGTGVGKRVE